MVLDSPSPDIKKIVLIVGLLVGIGFIALILQWLWMSYLKRVVAKKTKEISDSQAKFLSYIENSPYGIFITDEHGNYLEVNIAAAEITGYSCGELIGMNLIDLFAPGDIERAAEHFRIASSTGKSSGDLSFVRKDGSRRYWSVDAVKISDERFLGFVSDITDRIQSETERLKLRKLESVGILAGGIAHDFNNILTGLFGNIEMAKYKLSEKDEAYKFLETAMLSLDNASHLTGQLLTFAKGGEPVTKVLDIRQTVSESVEFAAHGSNIRPLLNISKDLWNIEADEGQISQVIHNLVINAKQAMPLGGTLRVNMDNDDSSEEPKIIIEVADDGMGIPPHHLDRIFDPYFSTKQMGSGLGLASCYSIIKNHGGTITVKSEGNQGTVFTILLPAVKAGTVSKDLEFADTHSEQKQGSVRVLVLDDEEIVREVIGMMLEKFGYGFTLTASGIEAVEEYRRSFNSEESYDLVLTDLTIPGGMGGVEAAAEILKIDPDATIIVSSGYASDPIMSNFSDFGFKGVDAKPYRSDELHTILEGLIEEQHT